MSCFGGSIGGLVHVYVAAITRSGQEVRLDLFSLDLFSFVILFGYELRTNRIIESKNANF